MHSQSHAPPLVTHNSGSDAPTSPTKGHFRGPSIIVHPDHSQDGSMLSPISPSHIQSSDLPITPNYQFGHDEHLAKHHNVGHTHSHAHEGHSDNMRGVFLHVMAVSSFCS